MILIHVAVLGAGNGGCAAAADLTRRGMRVSLYSRSGARLAPIQELGGLHYTGVIGEGFAPLGVVTNDLHEALKGADLVMIIAPAVAHSFFAEQLAEALPGDVPVLLNPGSTGGALHVTHLLRMHGRDDVVVAETATLTYACRMKGPTTSWIKNELTSLPFASFPGRHRDEVLASYRELYPRLTPAPNVLATALMNLNAIEHPPGMVMNAGWIEDTQGDFKFYYEGVTPAVARVLEAADAERMGIVHALESKAGLDLNVTSCIDLFYRFNYTTEEAWETGSMYQAFQASIPNRSTQAAPTLSNRYMVEDVPYGLVPLIGLAECVGVDVPNMRAVVQMASALMGEDYFAAGLSLTDMGLQRVPLENLARYLYEGRRRK